MGELIKRLYMVRKDQDEFLANKAFNDYNRKGNKKSTVLRAIIDGVMDTEKEGGKVWVENG